MMRLSLVFIFLSLWLQICRAEDRNISIPLDQIRAEEQTLLTFPEWYLVHSPAEYATFVKQQPPHDFPFIGHIGQLWSSYWQVTVEQLRWHAPANLGYHVMIMVITSSTTIEYGLRWLYENTLGRLSWALSGNNLTSEDRYSAEVAQQYVDFIRQQPWYLFDFWSAFSGLWTDTPWFGKHMIRKWERRYALTTEYLIKAAYAKMIGFATKQAYNPALFTTLVIAESVPQQLPKQVKKLKQLNSESSLLELPRYYNFRLAASELAMQGAMFSNIAGNDQHILLTVWCTVKPSLTQGSTILFQQPILTRPGTNRYAILVPVKELTKFLAYASRNGIEVEHVYDY